MQVTKKLLLLNLDRISNLFINLFHHETLLNKEVKENEEEVKKEQLQISIRGNGDMQGYKIMNKFQKVTKLPG